MGPSPLMGVNSGSCDVRVVGDNTNLQLFSYSKAVKLAAFSFAVYGDPTGGRWLRCPDGTDIGFQSDELVRSTFKSLLQVHILRARDLPQESSLIERALTGADCDAYVVTKVSSGEWSDVAVTEAKIRNRNPDFYERLFLWVQDPATAVLEFCIKEKNVVQEDEHIGVCKVALADLVGDDKGMEWSGWLGFQDHEANGDKGANGGKDLQLPGGFLLNKLFDRKKEHKEKIEVELMLVPLAPPEEEEEEEASVEEEEGEAVGSGPKSVLGIDWNVLGDRVGGEAVGLGRYRLTCFLSNKETDTQCGIWTDTKAKIAILSFRGTEITWKDLFTDLLIMQQPLEDGKEAQDWLVHTGFRRAFKSVQEAVHVALSYITKHQFDTWTIYCTGHSLGGALATLVAFDLAGRHPDMAREGRLAAYSYGAPRVGNTAFCREYDRRLKESSFRVINNLDIVARMPRTASQPVLDYQHVGKTVLVGEDMEEVWVEGESDGECPIREVNPFAQQQQAAEAAVAPAPERFGFAMPSLPTLTQMSQQLEALTRQASTNPNSTAGELADAFQLPLNMAALTNGSTASVQDMLSLASNLTNLQAMMKEPSSLDVSQLMAALPTGGDLMSLVGNETAVSMAARALGLNTGFVNSEVKLFESIVQGVALADHFEPVYYSALERSHERLLQRLEARRAAERRGGSS